MPTRDLVVSQVELPPREKLVFLVHLDFQAPKVLLVWMVYLAKREILVCLVLEGLALMVSKETEELLDPLVSLVFLVSRVMTEQLASLVQREVLA